MRAFLSRYGWVGEIALAALMMFLGLEMPFADAGPVALVSLPLMLLGAAWVVKALISPGPDGEPASLRRKQIALAFSTLFVALVVALAIASRVRFRSAAIANRLRGEQPQISDDEIGWAPQAPPGTVGQRLDVADSSRKQILLIGDSIIYGHGVGRGETVSSFLQKERPADQILNAAVSGYSIDQYYLYLRRILPHLNPELIVVGLFSGNDFQLTARELTWGKSKPLYAVEGGQLVRVGKADRCIDQLAGSLLFRALWNEPHAAKRAVVSLCRPRELRRGETEELLRKLFDEIDALAAQRGVPVLWLMLPVKSDQNVYDEERFLFTGRYPDIMRLLGERPRQIFDFTGDVAPRQSELDRLYLSDNAHFTPDGHALLARALDREITSRFPALGDGKRPR